MLWPNSNHHVSKHIISNRAVDLVQVLNPHVGKSGTLHQDLEEGLESQFKRLVKIRVSLLNILNH
ncbi:hypothetical protein CR513_22166, partial [Mucuna pruriens]